MADLRHVFIFSAVATRPKRPAELACEKMNDIRSAGRHNKTIPYIIHLIADDGYRRTRSGVLIEKRFVLITVTLTLSQPHIGETIKKLEFSFSDKVVSKKIKKVHTPIYKSRIILFELDSDVDYNYWLYPTCLYTSVLNPKSGLMNDGKTMKIVEDSNCYNPYSRALSSFKICVYGSCNTRKNMVLLVEEETTPQLFGFVLCNDDGKYHMLRKVLHDLDLIENIVWPKNGK